MKKIEKLKYLKEIEKNHKFTFSIEKAIDCVNKRRNEYIDAGIGYCDAEFDEDVQQLFNDVNKELNKDTCLYSDLVADIQNNFHKYKKTFSKIDLEYFFNLCGILRSIDIDMEKYVYNSWINDIYKLVKIFKSGT